MKNRFITIYFMSFMIVFANTIEVPEQYTTIQAAINTSVDNDTILVDSGIYYENIDFNGKRIVVMSRYIIEDDSSLIVSTIIDAGGEGSVVTFENNESNESVLQGFTIQNGIGNVRDPDGNGSFYTYGGGIYCNASEPIVKDCIIQDNTGDDGGGGGIFCYDASPIFYGCLITENETDDVGGGLYSRTGSSPQFFNCEFFDNVAEYGAGCYLRDESDPYMEDVIFRNNSANNTGGAIALKDDANLQANHLYIFNNSTDGLGGGFYINNADPILSFILIADNIASSGAGGYIRNNSNISFTNATFSQNSAGLYGNGLYLRDGCEIQFLNSILWGSEESQIYFRSDGDDVELNVSYTLMKDGEDSIEDNNNGDINWGPGNLENEPYFCNLSDGNYYLRENSPCIDGGQDNQLMGCFGAGCGPVNLGPTWYVDQNGNDNTDGSLDTPFLTIGHAISVASDGDTIRLNPGEYNENLNFDSKEIVMESRFYDSMDWDIVSNTYFSPSSNLGSCLNLTGNENSNVTIRGIAFKGGTDPYGGGLVVQNCSPHFENIIVEDNTSEIGGGVFISESDAVFKDCIIRNNNANIGGGVYVTDGTPLFEETLFTENIAYWGAALYFENAEPSIIRSILRENVAYIEGGAIYQFGGISDISWTSFESNHGYDFGGAIVGNEASIDLNQTTFTGNTSGIGSVFTIRSSAINIENSILWGNNGDLIFAPGGSGISAVELSYTDIEGGIDIFNNESYVLLNAGDGIINSDPQFCDLLLNNYTLREQSSCWTASASGEVIGAYDSEDCEYLFTAPVTTVPNEFYLSENYPNPFNPSTKINYGLSDDGFYSLKVFDIRGKLVRVLFSGEAHKGSYSMTWDGKNNQGLNVPSGVYIYTLESRSGTLSKRMLFLK